MERRKALAVASAATLVLGSAIVAGASIAGVSVLGLGPGGTRFATPTASADAGTTQKTRVVLRTRNVYDRFVVQTAEEPAGTAPTTGTTRTTATAEPTPPRQPTEPSDPPFPTTATTVATIATSPAINRPTADEPTSAPPTTQPAEPTTTIPTTPTTRPRGVPWDWPADTPIPPVPPNCREQRLQLNGVWNCDD